METPNVNTVTHTVRAGFVAAAVQFLLAVGASVGWGAAAGVASSETFLTRSSVKARIISTRHCYDLTVFPIEALRARARVIVL